MEPRTAPLLDRFDRHVGRSYLRLSEGVTRHRVVYLLEEALRLANLPGEDEGRIYCFRHVAFSDIPAEANRRVWTEKVQHGLEALARQAVHGSAPNASAANAVYFNNFEEALESLLRNAVRYAYGTGVAKPEWFSTSLLGLEARTSYVTHISTILQRLREPSIPPGAAAAILFAALADADPGPLLSASPSSTIREWVRALDGQRLDGQKRVLVDAPPVELPRQMKTVLQRAASHFGWKDPGTVWLAAQAVIYLSPGAASSGTAVKRARATLRLLEAEQRSKLADRPALATRISTVRQLVFDDDDQQRDRDDETADVIRRSVDEGVASPDPPTEAKLMSLHSSGSEVPSPDRALVSPEMADEVPRVAALLGEATLAAGFYFLLNALRRVGIVAALDECPALAEADLVTRILRQLAITAAVPESDPVLVCLPPTQPTFTLPPEMLANLPLQLNVWPKGFAPPQRTEINGDYFLRVWVLAVKWWCWRMGRITMREIVNRRGRIWLSRSDLDVTLPLAEADIRIRRIGLDIDPGWLPWLGEYGRVVRFHYCDREIGEPSC